MTERAINICPSCKYKGAYNYWCFKYQWDTERLMNTDAYVPCNKEFI